MVEGVAATSGPGLQVAAGRLIGRDGPAFDTLHKGGPAPPHARRSVGEISLVIAVRDAPVMGQSHPLNPGDKRTRSAFQSQMMGVIHPLAVLSSL